MTKVEFFTVEDKVTGNLIGEVFASWDDAEAFRLESIEGHRSDSKDSFIEVVEHEGYIDDVEFEIEKLENFDAVIVANGNIYDSVTKEIVEELRGIYVQIGSNAENRDSSGQWSPFYDALSSAVESSEDWQDWISDKSTLERLHDTELKYYSNNFFGAAYAPDSFFYVYEDLIHGSFILLADEVDEIDIWGEQRDAWDAPTHLVFDSLGDMKKAIDEADEAGGFAGYYGDIARCHNIYDKLFRKEYED